MNFNLHQSMSDNPHRFLNILTHGTYIRPHRHILPPKSETFILLRGIIKFITFNDDGSVENRVILSPLEENGGAFGVDISAGIWHSLFCISRVAACFEVKPGPYTQSNDKEFSPWSPEEQSPGVDAYMKFLEAC